MHTKKAKPTFDEVKNFYAFVNQFYLIFVLGVMLKFQIYQICVKQLKYLKQNSYLETPHTNI